MQSPPIVNPPATCHFQFNMSAAGGRPERRSLDDDQPNAGWRAFALFMSEAGIPALLWRSCSTRYGWTGVIRTQAHPNDAGDAGYTMEATIIEPY